MTLDARTVEVASPDLLSATVVLTVMTAQMSLSVHPSRQRRHRQKSYGVEEDPSCVTMAENVFYIDTCVMVRRTVTIDQMNKDVVSFPNNSGREIASF